MNSREFRLWLSGVLEGLACRDIEPRFLDNLMRKIEEYAGVDGHSSGAEDVPVPTPQPRRLSESLDLAKKYPPKKQAASAVALENSTPVADKPPYNPEDPQVVRLG